MRQYFLRPNAGDVATDYDPPLDPPLDPGIAPIVDVLRSGGFDTFESCQGGAGHAFPEPTVRFHGSHSEGFRALALALTHGLRVAELRRYWSVIDGERVGPYWEMTFGLSPRDRGRDDNIRQQVRP
ncbi:MAG: hypothetical protein ACRELD_09830 [Longimicrobiales bacterium]